MVHQCSIPQSVVLVVAASRWSSIQTNLSVEVPRLCSLLSKPCSRPVSDHSIIFSTLLANAKGPINVSITTERETVNVNPNRPSFLHGYIFGPANEGEWNDIVLPYVTTLTFTVESTTDCHYLALILASSQNPNLFKAITKISFTRFYWFTGVQHNRRHHPACEMMNTLPYLAQVSLRLHTAGITVSCYSEREMVAIEAHDPERAKARKVMHLPNIIAKYDLSALFSCRALRRVRIEYIDCEMTRFFTRVGDASDVLRDVQTFMRNGFFGVGLNVLVELVRVDG
jgi:hypothetical protein